MVLKFNFKNSNLFEYTLLQFKLIIHEELLVERVGVLIAIGKESRSPDSYQEGEWESKKGKGSSGALKSQRSEVLQGSAP